MLVLVEKLNIFYFVAKVTGTLQSEVSTFYLDSWPVDPYRTASALLIRSNFPLSLNNITSKLNLLVRLIPEVSSVTVQGRRWIWTAPLISLWSVFFFLQRNDILVEIWEWFMRQRTQCSGKNDSAAPQFPSPTSSVWVTVFCGMFPAIAENNTKASARTHMHTETHTHTLILMINHICYSCTKRFLQNCHREPVSDTAQLLRLYILFIVIHIHAS